MVQRRILSLVFVTEVASEGSHLGARVARDGDPEPIHIEDTDATFAVEWKGQYRAQGGNFVYLDGPRGGVTAIFGYPTRKLAQFGCGCSRV